MNAPVPILMSVVVPTYKRPDLLKRCLSALLEQDFPAQAYEIVVADDGPDDETRQLVEKMADTNPYGVRIRYIPITETQGPAGARNRGWNAARGSVIAFTDDDTIPATNWLTEGFKAMQSGVASVVGAVRVPMPEEPTDYERDTGHLEEAEFVTANCFVMRNALAALDGFDERYTLAWREDSDLHFSLLRSGRSVIKAPDAVVLHPIRPAPWGISIRQQRKVYFDALLYKKFPSLYRRRIRPTPPWNYYIIVLALFVVLGAAIARSPIVAGIAFVVWAVLTAQFCIKRLKGTAHTLSHISEMVVTSIAIPPLALYWRLLGALHFRVFFL